MNDYSRLFALLRAGVCGEKSNLEGIEHDEIQRLLLLAKKHDVTYCVAKAIMDSHVFSEESSLGHSCKETIYMNVVRIFRIEDTLKRVKRVLNNACIPFVPLKGAVIRTLYPDKMMRASCDIDVLVKEENLDQAIRALMDEGFSTDNIRSNHDVSLFYNHTHLELHFNICESMDDIDILLARVWDHVEPVSQYEYVETPDYLVFHHIAHMKYHFVKGGCGIRPFLDLYVLRKLNYYHEDTLISLLSAVGLQKFYDSILRLLQVWFEGKPHCEFTLKFEEYILNGGVYGNVDNRLAIKSSSNASRIKTAFPCVFPSFESMCILFPQLEGKKLLLPFYYARRIVSKAFGKGSSNARNRLEVILLQDKQKIHSVGNLMEELGISKEYI